MISKLLIKIIDWYQKTRHLRLTLMLSLGLMPYTSCKHQPSCSDYSKTVILKYGTIVGLTKTIKRVISCR